MKNVNNRNNKYLSKNAALNEKITAEKFLSANNIGMFLVAYPDCKIIDCNDIVLKELGFEKKEIVGEKIDEFINSKENFDNILKWKNVSGKIVKVTRKNKTSVSRVLQIIKINNKSTEGKRLLITFSHPVKLKKASMNENRFDSELEILRKKELNYRTLIEQSFEGIALINQSGNIVIWNGRLLDMLGYKEEDILRTNLWDTFSAELSKLTEGHYISKKGSRSMSFEYRIIRKNGSHFPAEINIRLLENGMIMLAFKDIADKKSAEEMREKLFDKLIEAQGVMKTLSRKLIQVQETERRNIARELHDEIGQTLTAIKIDIMNAMKRINDPGIKSQLTDTIQLAEGTLNNVRELSLRLRPSILDDLGLIPALRWYIDRQAQRTGIKARVITKQAEIKLPSEIQIAAYRIIQEAVNNIIKHSKAKNMIIEVDSQMNELHVTVSDDGLGYDVAAARKNASGGVSVGVLGMQERAELVGGWMDIISKPGKGTIIHAIFPYKQVSQKNIFERLH